LSNLTDVVGKPLVVGCKVVYAVSSGSAGSLRDAVITEINRYRVQVEIQGELSEYEKRTFYTLYREDKFYVVGFEDRK
jgi:hypothetical protein